MADKAKIVILPYYRFPCTEPVLVNVFAKELGKTCDIIWLFQRDTGKGKQRWYNSQILFSKAVKDNNWIAKTANRFLACGKFFQLLKLLIYSNVKIILIRDLPLTTLLIIPLKPFFRFKIYYQYSAPLGEFDLDKYRIVKTPKRFLHLVRGLALRMLVRQVLKRADIVFPITEFHKKELSIYACADQLIPLTMGVDDVWLKRKKGNIPYLETLKKRDIFILTYFGTISFIRKPKFILEVFKKVRERCSNCKLLVMGKTESSWEDEQLRYFCRNLKIEEHVIFTGQLDRDSLQDHLQYCDISISAIPPKDSFKISSPTKLYESMGNAIPVVANREIYEQEKVVLESGGGILVDYKITSFSEAIISLLNNKKLREKMASDGREYVIKNYSYKMIAKKIAPYFK